jgi:hypothetical protein
MSLCTRWSDMLVRSTGRGHSVQSHLRDFTDARHVSLFESRSLDFQRSWNVTLYGKVWPDVLHATTERDSASVRSLSREVPESDFIDRTCPVTHDWMRHHIRSALRLALLSGCVTGRSGSTRDRMRRLQTLAPRTAHSCCHWPDAPVVLRPRPVQRPVILVTSVSSPSA